MKNKKLVMILLMLLPFSFIMSQRKYNPPPMLYNIGNFSLKMDKQMGDGGMQSQFSWNLAGEARDKTTLFYWPQDEWQSNMLYQIFNPLTLDEKGIKDENGATKVFFTRGDALTNPGKTDWGMETRRYRPPNIVINGAQINSPYKWKVDPNLKTDMKIEFEDVLNQFGIRSHVEIFGFSNPDHADYFIWKATHKFTGEVKIPKDAQTSKDTLPDQTIRFWWPIAFSFGPSKAGERSALGGYSFEGEDDMDFWMKIKSNMPGVNRDSLYIAYYYDYSKIGVVKFANGSVDDMGDPDRLTGHLYSTQVPGYTLLYADKSASQKIDDKSQPYSLPHAGIANDLWGRRDVGLKLRYRGDDAYGHFPVNPPALEKGPMRFITVGPYELTKDSKTGRYDSLTFVYAVGVGGIGWKAADSIGKAWMDKKITDAEKDAWVLKGRDSLAKTLDRANWAWSRLSQGLPVPAAPPAPDIDVNQGPDRIFVKWSYPEPSYFNDAVTGVDDWYAWRVYRKRGAYLTNDPNDQKSGAVWERVFETRDKSVTTYVDTSVERGVDYYYAVTAVDNGSQGSYDIIPNQKLESARYLNQTYMKVNSVKPGLDQTGLVRIVPNPATSAMGKALASGNADKISFFNLPVKCKLRIFTETGDLVKTIDHYGTADDEWNQRTDENQYVSSGIYILAVTECQDINGKQLDNQFEKFIIVR